MFGWQALPGWGGGNGAIILMSSLSRGGGVKGEEGRRGGRSGRGSKEGEEGRVGGRG